MGFHYCFPLDHGLGKIGVKGDSADNVNFIFPGNLFDGKSLVRIQIKFIDTDHGGYFKVGCQLCHPFHVMDTGYRGFSHDQDAVCLAHGGNDRASDTGRAIGEDQVKVLLEVIQLLVELQELVVAVVVDLLV